MWPRSFRKSFNNGQGDTGGAQARTQPGLATHLLAGLSGLNGRTVRILILNRQWPANIIDLRPNIDS
jgi:hypothetical protein